MALIEPFIRTYGLPALFIIVYLESLGAPLPGESALIGASVMAIRGDLPIAGVFLSVWIAAVLGDTTGYAIGKLGGRRLLHRFGWLVKLTPERLASFEEMFRQKGAYIVLGARFVVVLRQLNGLIAGSMNMPFHKFLAANAIGGALWAMVWSLGPYFFGDLFGVDVLLRKP
ncbi:MAG: DedA family protein [Rhizobiaceae bacterium]|nr:DedA family protein [Rhizobiaceae bacterium]